MGLQTNNPDQNDPQLRSFTQLLLRDIKALEKMISENLFESGIRRIGAEQELFIVNQSWRPAKLSTQILNTINDDHFTPELGQFNIEINLDPLEFTQNCLSEMESQLNHLIDKLHDKAAEFDAHIVMTGILPTLTTSHLTDDYMTPNPRYKALDEALLRLRGGAEYRFNIKGVDELMLHHHSVMIEACNTSFQTHFQVSQLNFAHWYNIAQAVAGPVLAAANNSALLFGKRLWQETRIALFQQAVDTRNQVPYQRELRPRVSFGTHWIKDSVLEIFQEDISKFRVLFGIEINEDPFEALEAGQAPALQALNLHNGTVYRWNRACYGVRNGKPHLRIENRMLPSGPTVLDEIANTAFWFGLMSGMHEKYDDICEVMEFEDAKANFQGAAQYGLSAQFNWVNEQTIPAQDLICKTLLPMAQNGLETAGIGSKDIDRYLTVIEERVKSGRTGSKWQINSFSAMRKNGEKTGILPAITASMHNQQRTGLPVHKWKLAQPGDSGSLTPGYMTVEQFMETDMDTVFEEELIDLVAQMMLWNNARHILVEDSKHRLVGLITHRSLLRLVGHEIPKIEGAPAPVSTIMKTNPLHVPPDTSTLEAISIMRENRTSCLPVVQDDQLVGLVTENTLMNIAFQLLKLQLDTEN